MIPFTGVLYSSLTGCLVAKYGAVLLGVSIGTAAKYGLSMGEGRKVTTGELISDLLLVPLICLIAAFIGIRLGADPMTMAVISAFCAVSSDRLIRMMRERFIQRVATEIDVIQQHKGELRQSSQIELSAAHAREEGLNAPTAATSMIRHLDPTLPADPPMNHMKDEI